MATNPRFLSDKTNFNSGWFERNVRNLLVVSLLVTIGSFLLKLTIILCSEFVSNCISLVIHFVGNFCNGSFNVGSKANVELGVLLLSNFVLQNSLFRNSSVEDCSSVLVVSFGMGMCLIPLLSKFSNSFRLISDRLKKIFDVGNLVLCISRKSSKFIVVLRQYFSYFHLFLSFLMAFLFWFLLSWVSDLVCSGRDLTSS